MDRVGRLRWRCRRGAKELDVLLEGFLAGEYARLSAAEKNLFAELLECSDPELTDWLCQGGAPVDEGMAKIVERILSSHYA